MNIIEQAHREVLNLTDENARLREELAEYEAKLNAAELKLERARALAHDLTIRLEIGESQFDQIIAALSEGESDDG